MALSAPPKSNDSQRGKPRALVLTLPQADQPVLELGNQRYFLRNLSEDGIGLWVPPPLPLGMVAGAIVQAELRIGSEAHAVTLEVVHISARIAGLKMVAQSPLLQDRLRRLLEPAHYAAKLVPHAGSGQEDPTEHLMRVWYHTGTAAEITAWYQRDSRLLMKLQICCLGRWVMRTLLVAVQTGVLPDAQLVSGGRVVLPSELAHFDVQPLESSLKAAAQFLTAMPSPLPGNLFWQFLETGEQVFLPRF